MSDNDKIDPTQQADDPATEEAKKLAHELEKLGVKGIKDAQVIKTIAEKLTAVNDRPDRDVGH